MKRIFQFSHCTLHLYRKKIILFSVLSIGSSLISLFNTLLSGRFIDFLASPNCVEWKPQLCYYCILFLATIMISFAISFALGRIREKLHTMVSYNINRQMLVHIQQIPFSKTFFLDSSRITQQLQTDSNEIASYCINVIQNVPVSSVRLITVSVITYQINKTVFGILLILAALISSSLKYSRANYIIPQGNSKTSKPCSFLKHRSNCVILNLSKGTG